MPKDYKYLAQSSLPEEFTPIIASAVRRSGHHMLDVSIEIALDIEKLRGSALDVANALRALRAELTARGFPNETIKDPSQ